MAELRGNQEFMTALEQDHGQDPPALPAAAADRDRSREAAGSSGRHRPHLRVEVVGAAPDLGGAAKALAPPLPGPLPGCSPDQNSEES